MFDDFDSSAARALIHALSRRPPPDLAKRLLALAGDLMRIREGTAPTVAELAAAPRLENWALTVGVIGPVLIGRVIDHPILDARAVVTSPVWALDPHALAWARTLSRWYALGAPANAAPVWPRSDLH